ncbi:hypothetical protein NPIL_674301 [Nephila pilipes]|uniref:Uncharacterized protein n=1 Tax=Nephila pilipes TaxID=299642 RepID=A0A8X6PYD6_NEPPI|nr:hypothetical protein NPIL_674301 [Nephila pilipes]
MPPRDSTSEPSYAEHTLKILPTIYVTPLLQTLMWLKPVPMAKWYSSCERQQGGTRANAVRAMYARNRYWYTTGPYEVATGRY